MDRDAIQRASENFDDRGRPRVVLRHKHIEFVDDGLVRQIGYDHIGEAIAGSNVIGACATIEMVIAIAADKPVFAISARYLIIALAAVQEIIARAP